MAFSVIYPHTSFVSIGANKVKPKSLEKAVNDDPDIVTEIDRVRVENPGSGSVPDVDDPTGRTWAFIFVGAGPLSGPETTALDAIVAAHTGVEVYDPSPRSGGTIGQMWSNVDGTSYGWATPPGSGGGEANTTSNAGATGTGLALAKVGTDLPIAKIDGVNGISESLISSVMTLDGAALLPRDGSRAMTGALDMGGQAVTNVGSVDGRDVSADGATLTGHVGSSLIHVPALGTALQVLRVNAGASATEWATPAGGGAPGGAEGDLQFKNGSAFAGATGYKYENAVGLIISATPPDGSSASGSGIYIDPWKRPQFSEPNGYSTFDAGLANRVGFATVGAGSTGSRAIGGTSALVPAGTATATTYATTSARTAAKTVSYVPAATANTISSGAYLSGTTIRLPLSTDVSHAAFRTRFVARFGLTVASASNARFFAGIAEAPTSFTANPTASGSGMGTRMGIGFGDANSAVFQWITTQAAEANSVVSTGITATDGHMYYVEMFTLPLSSEVNGALWRQTAAGGAWTLVSSYTYDAAANSLSGWSAGLMVAGGNGATASGALTAYVDFAFAEMR